MMKQRRQTWYAIKCGGHVCGVMASYYSMELEHGELLFNATKQLSKTGSKCMAKFLQQKAVPCEELSVDPLLSEDGKECPSCGMRDE